MKIWRFALSTPNFNMATNIWGTTVDWSSRPSQIAVTSLWAGRFTSNLAARPPVQPVCVHVVMKNGNINVCRKETLGRESLHAVVMLIKGQGVEFDTTHGLRYVRPSVCQSFILVAIYCILFFHFQELEKRRRRKIWAKRWPFNASSSIAQINSITWPWANSSKAWPGKFG